jgi:hypothetical protein
MFVASLSSPTLTHGTYNSHKCDGNCRSDVSLIGFVKIHNKGTRKLEIAIAMQNSPSHWITVRDETEVPMEKELVYRVGFLPARFMRVFCRKGAPISIYSYVLFDTFPLPTPALCMRMRCVLCGSVECLGIPVGNVSALDEDDVAAAPPATSDGEDVKHPESDGSGQRWKMLSSEMRRVCVDNTIRCLYSPCVLPPAPVLTHVYPQQAGMDDRPALVPMDKAAIGRAAAIQHKRDTIYLRY